VVLVYGVVAVVDEYVWDDRGRVCAGRGFERQIFIP